MDEYIRRNEDHAKGYGSKMLELALLEAKAIGLKKVLITCHDTNMSSRKVAEKKQWTGTGRIGSDCKNRIQDGGPAWT